MRRDRNPENQRRSQLSGSGGSRAGGSGGGAPGSVALHGGKPTTHADLGISEGEQLLFTWRKTVDLPGDEQLDCGPAQKRV
jgi:hypothetical protein